MNALLHCEMLQQFGARSGWHFARAFTSYGVTNGAALQIVLKRPGLQGISHASWPRVCQDLDGMRPPETSLPMKGSHWALKPWTKPLLRQTPRARQPGSSLRPAHSATLPSMLPHHDLALVPSLAVHLT